MKEWMNEWMNERMNEWMNKITCDNIGQRCDEFLDFLDIPGKIKNIDWRLSNQPILEWYLL